MKRLISKEEIKKKERRNQWIVGIVLAVVMILSTLGFALNYSGGDSNSDTVFYKGKEFQKSEGYYVLNLGEHNFYFLTNPSLLPPVSKVEVTNLLPSYSAKPLYINSEDSTATSQIQNNLGPYVERMQLACLQNETCLSEDYPIKNCTSNFISVKKSSENKIYSEENCVFIEGKVEDLPSLTDRFILEILGIQ